MLDVRKAAVRGAVMGGVLEPLDLERFRPLLAGDEGTVAVKMAFSRDEESRYVIDVAIEADILAVCQRFLKPCQSTCPVKVNWLLSGPMKRL